jgi:hypothetical protein
MCVHSSVELIKEGCIHIKISTYCSIVASVYINKSNYKLRYMNDGVKVIRNPHRLKIQR